MAMSAVADGARPAATLALSKADIMHLQDISSRIKTIREPVREIMRSTAASILADQVITATASAEREKQYLRVREHIDSLQAVLSEYLQALPGAGAQAAMAGKAQTKTADARNPFAETPTRSRSSTQGSQDSMTYRMQRPSSLHAALEQTADAGASSQQYGSATLPALPSGFRLSNGSSNSSSSATVAELKPSQKTRAPLPDMLNPQRALSAAMATRSMTVASSIERAVVSVWRNPQQLGVAAATPVNEMYVRLGRRQVAPLEERVPQIPTREFASVTGAPVSVVDMVNSLMRSSASDNEASLLMRRIETLPPGVVACAIANSTSQLFQQLTKESIAQYASSGQMKTQAQTPGRTRQQAGGAAQPVLRQLSDHANYLTRLMESTIMYPMQASQRARRIEWWTVVACLLRELGDYESLSSLVCVFSSALVGRLRDTWDVVPAACKAAIRFLLERVLKIHPNYSQYREELHLRVRRMQKKRAKQAAAEVHSMAMLAVHGDAAADEASLDFDSAIAINSPDLASGNDNYVDSALYCKENFDLPPPRALVPIVAVLLKDAVSAEASSAVSPSILGDRAASAHWTAAVDSCANQDLPLSLDYFMLRRIFATELSALPALSTSSSAKSTTPRALSAATNFLRRMPRRQSSGEKGARELSMSQCRVLGAASPAPTIFDLLAHFLYVATGTPCFNCSVGAPLDALHVSSSGQLAVVVAAQLLFAEPWVPREYLARLCDLREPRMHAPVHSSRSPMSSSSSITSPQQQQQQAVSRVSTSSAGSAGETRAERPWLASFKLSDSTESARYAKPKGGSKHSSVESAHKTSMDSDSTCVNRPMSPVQPPPPPALERSRSG
ncbi:hypothetical protein GGI15_004529, partial [Coemansia interrupta]